MNKFFLDYQVGFDNLFEIEEIVTVIPEQITAYAEIDFTNSITNYRFLILRTSAISDLADIETGNDCAEYMFQSRVSTWIYFPPSYSYGACALKTVTDKRIMIPGESPRYEAFKRNGFKLFGVK